MMRRALMAVVLAVMALVLLAPVAVLARTKELPWRPACASSPYAQRQIAALAEVVVAEYDTVAPENASVVLRREIRKAAYFGRLECFVERMETAIRREIRLNQPLEDADLAVAWFREVVRLNK